MIEKTVIDQAITTHKETMVKIHYRLLSDENAAWRQLESEYNNARKNRTNGIKAAQKNKKNRRNDAWANYQRETRTVEGTQYSAYEEQCKGIDADYTQEIEHVEAEFAKVCEQAEATYRKQISEAHEKYRTDTDASIENFIAAHP